MLRLFRYFSLIWLGLTSITWPVMADEPLSPPDTIQIVTVRPQVRVLPVASRGDGLADAPPEWGTARLLSADQFAAAPLVVGGSEARDYLTSAHVIALAGLHTELHWSIWRPMQRVAFAEAEAEVVALRQVANARLTASHTAFSVLQLGWLQQEVRAGDIALPFRTASRLQPGQSVQMNPDVVIVSSLDGRRYLDAGQWLILRQQEGTTLQAGQRLGLSQPGAQLDELAWTLPERAIGQLMVTQVKSPFALALITDSVAPVSQATRVVAW